MDPLLEKSVTEKSNGMYVVTDTPFGPKNIKDRYDGIIGPLSIFAPYAHEDEGLFDDIEPSRPVTPIGEEIKKFPNNLEHLLNLVKRRITPIDDVSVVSKEDQKSMAAVLVGEVGCLWPSIRKLVDNPFLSYGENIELRRRTTIHIVSTCESLFKLHLKKAAVLQKRHVFSDPANMSRIRAQLALDAVNHLHLPSIRRTVLEKMRQDKIDAMLSRGSTAIPPGESPTSAVEQILSAMPELPVDTVIGSVPTELLYFPKGDSGRSVKPKTKNVQDKEKSVSDLLEDEETKIKRSTSMPNLALHDTLKFEMDLDPPRPLSPVLVFKAPMEKESENQKIDTKIDPKKDLDDLVQSRKPVKRDQDEEDDLPPILQALPPSRKKKYIPESFDEWLHEIPVIKPEPEKESSKKSPRTKVVPQPATVITNLTKKRSKVNIRASDIRISERNCITSLPIEKFTTVYNDLMDEIDPVTVKQLDKNVFVGDEIKEVYSEIMRTVPTDHLELKNDISVMPCADTVRVDAILSPSCISRRIENGTVNENLQKSETPPWGSKTITEWAKIPVTPSNNKQKKKEDKEEFPTKMLTMEEFEAEISDMPNAMKERLIRNYQSYLTWWKSTVSVEDYMKYLVRQETDFIGYMYHFYNKKEEEEEIESTGKGKKRKFRNAKQEEKSSGLESKIGEARAAKAEYVPGEWNVQSVLFGGLGRDPDAEELGIVEDVNDKEDEDTPRSKKSSLLVVKRSAIKTPSNESLTTARSKGKMSLLDQQSTARMSKSVSHMTQSRYTTQDPVGRLSPASSSTIILTHQDRLDKIWTLLRVPDAIKMDMAIKYSSHQYSDKLDEILEVWEEAVELVLEREHLLTQLENFERVASDPNRYFEKGFRGSSIARLEESKQRAILMKKVKQINSKVEEGLQNVLETCEDTVTFQGRPYKDKMKWDIIEMQHWLEEERKQAVLENHALTQGQFRQLRTVIAMT